MKRSTTPTASADRWVANAAARPPRTRGSRRWLGWLLLAALLLLTLLPVLVLSTNAGRRMLANAIEAGLGSEIPGSVVIGRLERFGFARPVVHDLRFMHPNGQEVLYVKRAEIDLHVPELLSGTIGFRSVRVEGGKLLIAVQPDGRTSLEAAFDAKGGAGEGARLALRSIHVENMHLLIRPGGDQVFDLRDVQGFVGVWQHGPPGVRVQLQRIAASLERPEFLGSRVTIARADGWVHGNVEHVLELGLRGRLGKEPLNAKLSYYDRDKTPVELELDPGGLKGGLAALGAKLSSLFTDTLDVKVR